jgi:hypothetical protein
MTQESVTTDGWREVIAPLAVLVDLEKTARDSGALVRRREIKSADALLRLAVGWATGHLSLRQSAAWAGATGLADLCDSALLRRLRKAADWLDGLVQDVLRARLPVAESLSAQGRLIRLVDGSTFGVMGADQPGWRLHAGFDLPTERMGRLVVTPASEGEGLERIAVTPGEVRIADRGFARPDGLRHMVDHGGHFLVRLGSRSLKLEDTQRRVLDWMAVFAAAGTQGLYDQDVRVRHGRKGRKRWPPLPARLIVVPLPADAAVAARARLTRAGQREGYTPSALAVAAAGHMVLLTSLPRAENEAATLLSLYRLRWQVELAFKRLKSLLNMRVVPTKDPGLARTWLCANLLVALLAEDFGAELGESPP